MAKVLTMKSHSCISYFLHTIRPAFWQYYSIRPACWQYYDKEYYGRMETKGSPWQCQSFQQSSIPSLFDTVKRLLLIRGKGHCKFMLAYVSRAKMWVTQYCIVIFFATFIQGLWIASSDELKKQKYCYNIIDLFDYKPPCPMHYFCECACLLILVWSIIGSF